MYAVASQGLVGLQAPCGEDGGELDRAQRASPEGVE